MNILLEPQVYQSDTANTLREQDATVGKDLSTVAQTAFLIAQLRESLASVRTEAIQTTCLIYEMRCDHVVVPPAPLRRTGPIHAY